MHATRTFRLNVQSIHCNLYTRTYTLVWRDNQCVRVHFCSVSSTPWFGQRSVQACLSKPMSLISQCKVQNLHYYLSQVCLKIKTSLMDHGNINHFASHRCSPSSIPGLGRGRMCEKFHQLLAVGRWFPPGTPVSSTRKLISSSSFHHLDMTLAVAEALNPNKLN